MDDQGGTAGRRPSGGGDGRDDSMERYRREVTGLVEAAFDGEIRPRVGELRDVGGGRGVFSVVVRAELSWPAGPGSGRPDAVVVKVPAPGPNGEAARVAGAYAREALAYDDLLPRSAVRSPAAYLVDRATPDGCRLVLEDLSGHRAVDQLGGLPPDDAIAVVDELRRFHRGWQREPSLAQLPVRRHTIATLDPAAVTAGLRVLGSTWADELTDPERRSFAALVAARPRLVEAFERAGGTPAVTLCHGDPRADNLVFDDDGRAVLFDWQQVAVQIGEADVAWLAVTSLDVEQRRRLDRRLVEAYGGDADRYRLGMALPGLAVLLLAQRRTDTTRSRRLVATSLRRIAAAVADLDVVAIGRRAS